MSITTDHLHIHVAILQPSELHAVSLAILFNVHGWDTKDLRRQSDGQYEVRLEKRIAA